MEQQSITNVGNDIAGSKQLSPPYVSYMTFRNLIEWLAIEGVPLRFDRSFWSKKYNGSIGPQLMSGIRFLGLLVEDEPTPLLEHLVNSSGDDRKEALRSIYRNAYKTVGFDALQRATPRMLREWFGTYAIDGTTLRKAESFFINAIKDADEPLSNSLKKLSRNKASSGGTSASANSKKGKISRKSKVDDIKGPDGATTPSGANRAGVPRFETNLPVASQSLMIWGLFQSLPTPGTVFDDTARERWIKAAEAIFEVEYQPAESPISDAASTPDDTGVLEGR